MDVKEAVQTAKAHIADLYADESIRHIGLEEVAFDDEVDAWKVTIGFFREWGQRNNPTFSDALSALPGARNPDWRNRSFKVVRIDNETGKISSMTHRSLPAAE